MQLLDGCGNSLKMCGGTLSMEYQQAIGYGLGRNVQQFIAVLGDMLLHLVVQLRARLNQGLQGFVLLNLNRPGFNRHLRASN